MGRTKKRAKERKVKIDPVKKHKPTIPSLIDNVIREADIIFEVLDSRFIEKTRNKEIEERVKSMGKTLIYILAKSDLVDIKNLETEPGFHELKPKLFFSIKNRKGVSTLRRLIKIEVKRMNQDIVNIGVIGYPNTGKSSLINIMTGKAGTRTSSEAGYTRGIQKLKIQKGVYLIDSPGIIPPEEKSYGQRLMTKHTKIGASTWHRAKDPDVVVFELMKEYPNVIESHYKIEAEGDIDLLIERLGRKLNFLKKGGVVDEDRTAKLILREWQEGKIRV